MEELSVFIPWEGAAGKTVLVAEDNEINAEIIKFQMEDMGFSVERASNGEEAFDMFEKSEEGKYSVIIMDIMMPVMDGMKRPERLEVLSVTTQRFRLSRLQPTHSTLICWEERRLK